jgi:pimeloyl-ACP methyl ester carboxylesterase
VNPGAFVSGWAGYAPLFPRLSRVLDFIVPFVDADEPELARRLGAGGRVLVAWSTGAHMVLRLRAELFPRFEKVVLVAPFVAFCDYVPREPVLAMRQAVAAQGPGRTVRAFHRSCGLRGELPEAPGNHGPALARGLDYLLTSRALLAAGEDGARVRVVHGAGDRVLPLDASAHVAGLLSGSWRSLVDAGHHVPEDILLGILHEETGCGAFQPRG